MNKFLKPLLLTLLGILMFLPHSFSQEKRRYYTSRIQGNSPKIDGYLDDAAWEQVSWENTFTQYQPSNGEEPSQQTAFKILYGKNNIYIAIRAYDTEPEKIVKRMSRRDGFQGDWVEIAFDSYHDFTTAYSFTASVAGVKSDELYTGDGFHTDKTWDPIWFLKTSIDDKGWIAEIKIPLTQLRFSDEADQVWGLEVKRFIYREQERSLWQHIPNQQAGYVSRFGELHGLKNLKPKKQFDITPYLVASYEKFEADAEDPFTDGTEKNARVGVDAKIGLTNNLTLDLTINPDFGQVEADPSEVNLSAFESYFAEKRLFFIEGRSIYSFPLRIGGGDRDNLFYSRRIGRSPRNYPDDYSYIDIPRNTSILGAAKITGKTKSGLSIGILESVTDVEKARFSDSYGNIENYVAEPLTNYFVGRLQQELNEGNTKIGGMITSTNRKIETENLKILPTAAYTGGVNFEHSWKNRKYTFATNLMGSHILGSTDAISELQLASARYYQRPDATHFQYNPTLTSLSGHAGSVSFQKSSNGGGWNYILWYSWQSPGFEINDLGYLRYADDMTQIAWAQYDTPKPFGIIRKISVEGSQFSTFDYSGKFLGTGGDISYYTQFTNFWSFRLGAGHSSSSLEKTLLRGGPLFRQPASSYLWGRLATDNRKNLYFSGTFSYHNGADNFRIRRNFSLNITYRPVDNVKIELQPSFNYNNNQLQYIDELSYQGNPAYILAEIKQKTFVTRLRVDYSITPDFSIQYYGQPFISTGNYSNYKYVTNPTASNYTDRFTIVSPNQDFGIDFNNDNEIDGYIEEPDFKYLQFQSNLVARWEYRPGSILFLVWSQNKTDIPENNYIFDFYNDMDGMFAVYPHNVFLVKLSYRIPI